MGSNPTASAKLRVQRVTDFAFDLDFWDDIGAGALTTLPSHPLEPPSLHAPESVTPARPDRPVARMTGCTASIGTLLIAGQLTVSTPAGATVKCRTKRAAFPMRPEFVGRHPSRAISRHHRQLGAIHLRAAPPKDATVELEDLVGTTYDVYSGDHLRCIVHLLGIPRI